MKRKRNNKRVTVEHMGYVYSVYITTLYYWLYTTLYSTGEESFGKKDNEYFCYVIPENNHWKVTNKKPITDTSKSNRRDYCFDGITVGDAKRVLSEIKNVL